MHLSEPEHLFKFLSLLWGYSNNLSDQLEFRVTALLQTQALYVSKVLLSALPVKKLNILASPSSTGTETYSPSSTQNAIFLQKALIICVHSEFESLFFAARSGAISPGVSKLWCERGEKGSSGSVATSCWSHHLSIPPSIREAASVS